MMRKPVEVFGASVHPWTMEETLVEIERRLDLGIFTQHGVVNVAKLVNMRQDGELRHAVLGCDIVNVDGMGVVWGARWLGAQIPERVAGIDLFERLLEVASQRGRPVYLLGAQPAVLDRAVSRIRERVPELRIAGCQHGYFWGEEEATVEDIRSSGAEMLFVGISSPAKERFIQKWKKRLGVRFVMGVGGSLDVLAGKTKRAPVWMQQSGTEWLYRVVQEPGRMWRRYLVTNTRFVWWVVREKTHRWTA